MKKIIFFCFIIFLSSSYAQKIYYFSSSQGNDSNDGLTSNTPKQTLAELQALLESSKPGDNFLLKRGDTWTTRGGASTTYAGIVGLDLKNCDGSVTNYITIGAYGTSTDPTFDFTGNGAAFQLEGCTYTIIRDLRIVGTASDITNRSKAAFHGIGSINGGAHYVSFINVFIDGVGQGFTMQDASDHITIDYCTIQNTIGGTVLQNGTWYLGTEGNGLFANIDYLTIKNSLFKNNGRNNPNELGHEHAIYTLDTESLIIENCTMYTEPTWSVPCSPLVVIGNARNGRMTNCTIYNAEYVGVVIETRSYGKFANLSENFIIEKNYIHDNGYIGIWVTTRLGAGSGVLSNIIIRNNIISNNTEGIFFDNIYNINDIYIENNNFNNNKGDAIDISNDVKSLNNLSIKNNIFYNNSTGTLLRIDNAVLLSGLNLNNNLYYSVVGSDIKVEGINLSLSQFKLAHITEEINSISENPLFANPSIFDFHINGNSPAIDKGAVLTNVTDDFDGNLRPAGTGFDIGAYEYGSTQGSSNIRLNIKVLLEGPFSNGSMSAGLLSDGYLPLTQPYNDDPWNYNGTESVSSIPSGVIDWVLLELRSGTASSTVVSRKAAFFKSDGSIVDLDGISQVGFNSVSGGNYYIVILHRNHLPVMSANAVSLSVNSALYDFTTSSSKAYGTDALADLGGGKWGLYAGDSDKNGTINVLDYGEVINFLFETGYKYGDLDLNGIINVLDYSKTNSNLFKSTQVPN